MNLVNKLGYNPGQVLCDADEDSRVPALAAEAGPERSDANLEYANVIHILFTKEPIHPYIT